MANFVAVSSDSEPLMVARSTVGHTSYTLTVLWQSKGHQSNSSNGKKSGEEERKEEK